MSTDASEGKKKRVFKKFTYRGIELDNLLDLSHEQLMSLLPCRARRKFTRGLNRKQLSLIKKLRKAKSLAGENERPATIKTHLRNMVIVPEMIGSVVGVYNGQAFTTVEVRVRIIIILKLPLLPSRWI